MDEAVTIGMHEIVLAPGCSPQRARFAAQTLANAAIDYGDIVMLEAILSQIYRNIPKFQFTWAQHLKISEK